MSETNENLEVENNEEVKASEETSNVENLEEKKKEEDFKSKFYYLAAEMDNMKKRYEREKENFLKYGNEKILSGLVEVIDNLDRSLDAIKNEQDEKIKSIVTGIDMVRNQFLTVLKNNGLERIESVGQIFDPNFHEALAQQPAEGKQDQEVIMEYQTGYVLNGRLLRAAKVVIAKND
jgi:molecular chaperone GrpE